LANVFDTEIFWRPKRRPPKISGPVRPNTSNMPKAGPGYHDNIKSHIKIWKCSWTGLLCTAFGNEQYNTISTKPS